MKKKKKKKKKKKNKNLMRNRVYCVPFKKFKSELEKIRRTGCV